MGWADWTHVPDNETARAAAFRQDGYRCLARLYMVGTRGMRGPVPTPDPEEMMGLELLAMDMDPQLMRWRRDRQT